MNVNEIPDGIHTDISIHDYHANRTHVSASGIKEAKKSLAHFRYYLDNPQASKTQFDFGNSFELALLDPKGFEKEVAIEQDSYWIALANEEYMKEKGKTYASPRASTRYKAEYSKWEAANEGKYKIAETGKESFSTIEKMLANCRKDSTIQKLIEGTEYQLSLFWTDPETGLYLPQRLFNTDGTQPSNGNLRSSTSVPGEADSILANSVGSEAVVLQLSSTIRDFRYASQMTEYLERSMRAGDRYVDFVQRNFGYNPNPLYIDRPVWIGGYTGNIVISDVMATAQVGDYTVGQYAGKALAADQSPIFTYTTPDYGFIIGLFTVYPKASYYSGLDNMWRRVTKMDYMWEQFALIGDQPLTNQEVWFSWYDADIAWNEEIFGYLPQYAQFKYSNDIVSGQMRTLWEAFHLGRKFDASGDIVLNSQFIECRP